MKEKSHSGSAEMIRAEKPRNTNLELFRIITMMLIVAHHYVVNSGLYVYGAVGPLTSAPTSFSALFLFLLGAWGKIGINCFVLITGYFMCKSKITAKKFFKIFLTVVFYNVILNGIFWITGYQEVSIMALFKSLFPLTSVATGFTSAYLWFFLLIPFLNLLIHNMNQKQHLLLLLLLFFVYVVSGTLKFLFTVTMNYVSWFSVLYLLASYVRIYPCELFSNTKFWGVTTVVSVVLCVLSVVGLAWMGSTKVYYFVTDSNTFLAVLTGFSAFMFFNNVNIKFNPAINAVAGTCFGVLQIHANSDAMRSWLWGDVLNNLGVYEKIWMPLHAFGSVLGVFLICAGIDLLRIRFVEKPFFRLWDRCWPSVSERYTKAEAKLLTWLHIS